MILTAEKIIEKKIATECLKVAQQLQVHFDQWDCESPIVFDFKTTSPMERVALDSVLQGLRFDQGWKVQVKEQSSDLFTITLTTEQTLPVLVSSEMKFIKYK
jgi:hypothetical protein